MQLKVTVPADAVASTRTWNTARFPAVTIWVGVLERKLRAAPMTVGSEDVLFPGVVSVPPPETETLMDEVPSDAFGATLNVTVMGG